MLTTGTFFKEKCGKDVESYSVTANSLSSTFMIKLTMLIINYILIN